MLYVKNNVEMKFKTKREPNIECGLGKDGECFYVLIYSDFTAVCNGQASRVCFPVPVHYPSFLLTLSGNLQTPADKIFNFKTERDKEKFKKYAESCNMAEACIIEEFKHKKK
ncbi:hypothetical protein NGRA_2397 [Nosema granulosis]|uniref:Uncharacterized protein n=1 Tax=Nosema granulosis TaxID=83296 RepID=A0A9P6GZY4_9MICR|nr:hypothetical protein NGRA_2397 [Nosema granulosis]